MLTTANPSIEFGVLWRLVEALQSAGIDYQKLSKGLSTDSECKIHALKIDPVFFEKISTGDKTFELRKNDRDFRVRDILLLEEYFSQDEIPHYSGKRVVCEITSIVDVNHIMEQEGGDGSSVPFVALSISRLDNQSQVSNG